MGHPAFIYSDGRILKFATFKIYSICSENTFIYSTKEIKSLTGARFERATHELLAYCLSYAENFEVSYKKEIAMMSFLFISKESASHNVGVPFPVSIPLKQNSTNPLLKALLNFLE